MSFIYYDRDYINVFSWDIDKVAMVPYPVLKTSGEKVKPSILALFTMMPQVEAFTLTSPRTRPCIVFTIEHFPPTMLETFGMQHLLAKFNNIMLIIYPSTLEASATPYKFHIRC